MRRSAAARLTMRARAAAKMWSPPCAPSRRNSADDLRLTPAGGHSSKMTDTHIHAPPSTETEPCGDLCIRTLAMPADTNANGDIFGGWLLSQMDLGGDVFASKVAKSRTVT